MACLFLSQLAQKIGDTELLVSDHVYNVLVIYKNSVKLYNNIIHAIVVLYDVLMTSVNFPSIYVIFESFAYELII